MRLMIIVMSSALWIAGCAPAPVERTNPTITYAHNSGEADQADAQARQYCLDQYQSEVRILARETDRTVYECLTL